MPKCVYCGKMYEPPRGLTVVTNKGNIHYFCSSKCRKNKELGRRKVRWIEAKKPLGAKVAKKSKAKKPKSRKKK